MYLSFGKRAAAKCFALKNRNLWSLGHRPADSILIFETSHGRRSPRIRRAAPSWAEGQTPSGKSPAVQPAGAGAGLLDAGVQASDQRTLVSQRSCRSGHHEPLQQALAGQQQVVVPYCVGTLLKLFWLKAWSDLQPGAFGILEPKPELQADRQREVPLPAIDFAIIPGVAFDRAGHRLGHGKAIMIVCWRRENRLRCCVESVLSRSWSRRSRCSRMMW